MLRCFSIFQNWSLRQKSSDFYIRRLRYIAYRRWLFIRVKPTIPAYLSRLSCVYVLKVDPWYYMFVSIGINRKFWWTESFVIFDYAICQLYGSSMKHRYWKLNNNNNACLCWVQERRRKEEEREDGVIGAAPAQQWNKKRGKVVHHDRLAFTFESFRRYSTSTYALPIYIYIYVYISYRTALRREKSGTLSRYEG